MKHTIERNENYGPLTLITGASAGIGLACAEELARMGRPILLTARREHKLQEHCERISLELGSEAKPLMYAALDVTDLGALKELKHLLIGFGWEVDVLINNAGLALGRRAVHENTDGDIAGMIGVNVQAFTHVHSLFLPMLRETQGFCIALGSVAGREPYPGGAIYCGTKAYVHQMMQASRIDNLGSGVRFTTIAPGAVGNTEFSNVRFDGDLKAVDAVYQGYAALSPEDVARTIGFVLQQPEHVTLQHIDIMPTAQASARDVYRERLEL